MATPTLHQSPPIGEEALRKFAKPSLIPVSRKGSTEVFPALDGLRFIAAIAVVCFHYATKVAGFNRLPFWFTNTIQVGPLAITFFFVLSGVVLAHRYSHGPAKKLNLRSFWLARFARLYPAYGLAFVLFVPIAVVKYLTMTPSRDFGAFFGGAGLYLTMLQAWTPFSQSWNGPSWSVSVEAFFYLMFPFITTFVRKLNSNVNVALCAACCFIPFGLTVAHNQRLIPGPVWQGEIRNNPLFWAPMFLCGLTIARYLPAWKRVSDSVASLLTLAACSVTLLLAAFCEPSNRELLINGAAAPLLALVVLCASRKTGLAARALGSKLLSIPGKASYALYIVQAPLWHYFSRAMAYVRRSLYGREETVSWLDFLAYLSILIAASLLIEHYFERPIRSKLRQWQSYETVAAVS